MSIADKARAYTNAWNSKDPAAVAAHFTPDGEISINRGALLKGTDAIAGMAAGFHAAFPDLLLHCDLARSTGSHALYVWTLQGHHADTKNFVKVGGWEEWDLDGDMLVTASAGWFDAEDYQRQIDAA
jgi:uncharacterized protein (TIGR02246 family)